MEIRCLLLLEAKVNISHYSELVFLRSALAEGRYYVHEKNTLERELS
jgi:hypothetical protein